MTPGMPHREIDELLPWYANGTLEEHERVRVEHHLAECETCRSELALLRDIGEAASVSVRATPDVADALGGTLARIEEWEQSRRPSPRERLRAALQGIFGTWQVPRLVLVGQSALILILGAMLFLSRPPDATFTTLSGGGEATDGIRLTVIFEPSASEEAIRQVLRTVEGTIVSGPSASGVYVVTLPLPDSDTKAVDAAIAVLEERSSIIRFVEREP